MPDRHDRIQFRADRGDARLRLDQVLARRITQVARMSRRVTQGWIESGCVRVNGLPVRLAAASVRAGDAIEVAVPADATWRSVPQAEPLDISVLYEDGMLMAIDKPPGIVVHPSYKQTTGTLLNAVLWRLRDRPDARPGILTRLDKDTSGLVIVALSAEAHATMQRDAAAGLVRKDYLALVRGIPAPAAGTIREPLARDPADRRRVIVSPGGAASETRYDAIDTRRDGNGAVALVRCRLVTGRTHQIRVHLASRGWPIVGDRLYGSEDARMPRQALHAWRVSLPHPVTREPLTLVAPVAEDMAAAAAALGFRLDALRQPEGLEPGS